MTDVFWETLYIEKNAGTEQREKRKREHKNISLYMAFASLSSVTHHFFRIAFYYQ